MEWPNISGSEMVFRAVTNAWSQSRDAAWRIRNAFWVRLFAPRQPFYVVSHERSGTHYLINTILLNTYVPQHEGLGIGAGVGWHNIGEWFGPYDDIQHRFDHIEAFDHHPVKRLRRHAAIIKSHCDRELYAKAYQPRKVVYMARDPRDVLVSWFHYLNNDAYYRYNPMVPSQRCPDVSTFLRQPLSPFLRWCFALSGNSENVVERLGHHLTGWIGSPDALTVRYEALKQNYVAELQRVAEHTGIRMRRRTVPADIRRRGSILPRKGVVGDWRAVFREQDERFVRETLCDMGVPPELFVDDE